MREAYLSTSAVQQTVIAQAKAIKATLISMS
jgi:hypothetical protein